MVSCLKKILYKGSRKKKISTNGQALKRVVGGKGRAIKEKGTFFETLFLILLPSKNKKLFYFFRQLIEIWTYHVKICQ